MSNLRREALLMVAVSGLGILALAITLVSIAADIATGVSDQGYWTVRLVPIVLYFLGMCVAGWAGWQIAQGREFTLIVPRLLSLIGALLALAGLWETFGTPVFRRWLGQTDWQGVGIFDPSYIAIGSLGLLLWLLGRVMRRAVEMAQELEEIP